jgi:hypothetical protein
MFIVRIYANENMADLEVTCVSSFRKDNLIFECTFPSRQRLTSFINFVKTNASDNEIFFSSHYLDDVEFPYVYSSDGSYPFDRTCNISDTVDFFTSAYDKLTKPTSLQVEAAMQCRRHLNYKLLPIPLAVIEFIDNI